MEQAATACDSGAEPVRGPRVPIRLALFGVFAALALLVTGMFVVSSAHRERRVAEEMARTIMDRLWAVASGDLRRLFDPVQHELAEDLDRVRMGQVPLRDTPALRDLHLPTMRQLEGVGSMMVGDESGYQWLLMRYDELVARSPLLASVSGLPEVSAGVPRYFTREVRASEWGERSEWTLWDDAGTAEVAHWSVDLAGYDPRQRDWHVQALTRLRAIEAAAEGEPRQSPIAWTAVYTLFTSKTPGISASGATRDPNGNVTIVAYDVLLDDLSALTRSLRPTPRGRFFVCSDAGQVIALPSEERFEDDAVRLSTLLQPVESLGGPCADWARAWRIARAAEHGDFAFDSLGERWRGSGRPYEIEPGRRLWIAAILPEADLLALAGHEPSRFLIVALLGLLASLLVALVVSRLFSAPLGRLVEQSRSIGAREPDERPPLRSVLAEVADLGGALSRMGSALRLHDAEREESVAALTASEERFRATFEQAAVGMVHVDTDGRFLLVNDRTCQFLGRSREQLLALGFADVTHPDERAADLARFEDMVAGRVESRRWEKRYLHGDGHVVWAAVTAAPVRRPDGLPIYCVGVMVDITERKRLEQALLQTQALEVVGRLAGGVAHDFNNMLTIVMGHVEEARRSLPAEHAALVNLELVAQAAADAGDLTRRLLSFARRDVAAPEVLDLVAELKAAAPMLRPLVGEAVQLVFAVESGPLPVLLDPIDFKQLIVNLAANARAAMPAGGSVTFSASRLARGDGSGEVVLNVTDTGTGMSKDVLAHAFEPFFTTRSAGGGTGLGLPTCYGIVQRSGGSIRLESALGCGTTVSVTWPEAAASSAPTRGAAALAPAPGGGETILVAEDDPSIRRLVGRLLVSRGYRVVLAEDGVQALALAAEESSIDLLLSDVVMPRLNGSELALQLRARWPELRILFVSGYATEELGPRVPEGMHLLGKPYTPDQLLARVRAILDGPPES